MHDSRNVSLDVDASCVDLVSTHSYTCRREMTGVRVGLFLHQPMDSKALNQRHYLEANEIGTEHSVEDFVSSYNPMVVSQKAEKRITAQGLTRQTPEDLAAWERRVYKQSNNGLRKELSNQLRYE